MAAEIEFRGGTEINTERGDQGRFEQLEVPLARIERLQAIGFAPQLERSARKPESGTM
jgi:hypothetical protein